MAEKRIILLVEDEPIIAVGEEIMLRKEGYEVILASNGIEAIAKVNDAEQKIALILMDINLGKGIDGTQAAQEILKEHDIPIIFLSSHTEPEVVEKTEKITSYGYVVKNTGITVLDASIKMAFKLHTAHQELRRTNEMLNLAQEASRAGTWDWDIAHHNFDWSPEFLRDFGKVPGTNVGAEDWNDVVHPDDREIAVRKIREAIDTKTDLEIVYRIVLPGGEVHWIRATGKTYYDGNRPRRMIGLRMDITENKQAEEKLRQNEAQLSAIFNNPRDAIGVSKKGLLILANPAFVQMFGYENAAELIGKPVLDLITPEFRSEISQTIEKRSRGEAAPSIYETTALRRDGTAFPAEVSASTYTIAEEIFTLAILRDITRRKQAAANISFQASLLDQVHNGVIAIDFNNTILYWNKYAEKLYQWTSEEAVGKNIIDLLSPEEMKETVSRNFADMNRDGHWEGEFNVLRKDGSTIPMHITNTHLKDRYGNLIGFIGISVDITERKLAEKALENSERNLRLVLENTYDGINMLDLDTNRYIFLSPSQIKMTGFSAEELEQMTDDEVLEHVHPEDRQISANQKRMIATGEEVPASTEYRWEIKSGEYRWFSDTRTLIRNDQGKPIALVGVSRDITERKQTEAILRQTLLEKSLLVQELQHRVKNSLVIAASLLALEEGNLPDDRTRAIFANTRARFQSMAAVYEQLYQEGGVDQIELHHYIERLVEALSKSYLQPGQMKIVTQLAEVQLDLKRTLTVGLILNELIINAVHYAFPEGRISPGGSGIIRVEMAQTAGQVILCVADNGIGMTDETSRPGGMGLILVKLLTRQMDGTFTREDGNGCTFRVTFNLD